MVERSPGPVTTPAGVPLPPQVTMGLLNYITAHSLDGDYAQAASARAQASDSPEPPPRRGAGRRSLVVLLLFGLLIATAAVQTARTAPARQNSQASLVEEINEGRAALAGARRDLREAESELALAQLANREAVSTDGEAQQRARRLGLAVGSIPVRGGGVRIVADDAENPIDESQLVFDKDLQSIANGLWEAGAEAIAINGQRLTTMSGIRFAGNFINVNDEPIVPPYVVLAIGDPDTLPALFVESTGGTRWLSTQQTLDLQFAMTSEDALSLPAAPPARLRPQFATNPAQQVEGNS